MAAKSTKTTKTTTAVEVAEQNLIEAQADSGPLTDQLPKLD